MSKTLAADIPGLLRQGMPVIVQCDPDPANVGLRGVFFTILKSRTSDEHQLLTVLSRGDLAGTAVIPLRKGPFPIALDLSEPAGRDIAARWMAERLGLECGLTAPSFYFSEGNGVWPPAWKLAINGQDLRVFRPPSRIEGEHGIPGLPLDPARGIEAMRLCVLHLAGRSP